MIPCELRIYFPNRVYNLELTSKVVGLDRRGTTEGLSFGSPPDTNLAPLSIYSSRRKLCTYLFVDELAHVTLSIWIGK